MGSKRGLLLGVVFVLFTLIACSHNEKDPKKYVRQIVKKMEKKSYDFDSKIQTQAAADAPAELLVLEGAYVADQGYSMQAVVQLPVFESTGNILAVNDQLFYKLTGDKRWKLTTAQDLRMLGITYKDSPTEMLLGMADSVLTINPKGDGQFQMTLDRKKYGLESRAKVKQLPQVDMSGTTYKLRDHPVVRVTVDMKQQVIRSLTLSYRLEAKEKGKKARTVKVTYEVNMRNFNKGQTLPSL